MNHLFNRIAHYLNALLGAWPGLVTGMLLTILLVGGLLYLTHTSPLVSAKGTSPSALAQMATRSAMGSAALAATTTPNESNPTVTLTVTPASQTAAQSASKATLTPSPFATATQVADSPLLAETGTPTQVVPLPAGFAGPNMVPVDISPIKTITSAQEPSETQASGKNPVALLPTVTPANQTHGALLPVPTPTPTATPSIIEALDQPISPGGIAAVVASATALAPAAAETPTEFPTVTEAEPTPLTDIPAPTATVFSEPTPDGNVRTAYVPILMYHYLSVPPADADAIRLDLSVTPDLFAAHLDAMQQAGYTTISLYTLLDNLTQGTPLPEKPVVISFDDGYRDNYTDALPILRDHNMTATFFIVPDFIDNQRPEYLTWDMVREMYAAGMSIEGHGRNHVSLANKDHDYLIWQALGSYEAIQRELGVRPHFLAYPAGEYDQATIDVFRSANFWAAVTTEQGATHSSDDLFELKRVRVHGTTTPEQLLALLEWDW